ncbi:MAG: type 2 isopentenyl-diphosphate Delta-isomerase [Sulfobacillus acidophilus]|uniref:Isopentenyl-diphosphate delta-isomerase n=1 Tax=Sulfobacillus acidophilus TaxID=53633 RepID=A0A2T2WH19_9FIRM|nr:MAG: type 2 isopentenyl-diphosphate Delta-isomerase [Sulfobacillus acidophilus]
MEERHNSREQRKEEHIQAVQALPDQGGTGFEDVVLLPESASEVNFDEVSIDTNFLGHSLRSPVMINAMTGGTPLALQINQRLASFARHNGLAMAVGSETAALDDPAAMKSYAIVRETNPDGLVIANVGMGTTVERAQQAIDLIDANLLQIHWNTAQELFMAEGDRNFRGMLARFAEVCEAVSVPVIAKEVGQGMSGRAARRFVAHGARGIDIGGMGGTNFIAVEAWRRGVTVDQQWLRWGVPTAASLTEVVAEVKPAVAVIASGGIRSGHDVAKALSIGAHAVGIAGPLMRLAVAENGQEAMTKWLEELHLTLKMIMVLSAVRTVPELRRRPVLVMGRTREWLQIRGYLPFIEALGRRQSPGD